MLTTPPVKNVVADCVQQYKNVNSVLDTPMFATPTPIPTPDANPYKPSADDGNKIQTTIETLRRLRLGTSMISDKDNIDKIINQLSTDLMYFKIKNNG
jgi:hypothetical protein